MSDLVGNPKTDFLASRLILVLWPGISGKTIILVIPSGNMQLLLLRCHSRCFIYCLQVIRCSKSWIT